MADRVAVMYAGQFVEIGTADEIFYNPMHPYTWGLLASMPTLDVNQKNLYTIPGSPPNLLHPPVGDAFAARNDYALAIDFQQEPEVFKVTDTHYAKTWLLHPDAPDVTPPLEVVRRKEKYEALFSVKMYANSTGGGINGG
jgi:oligopeptide transport system ATP-binding protein